MSIAALNGLANSYRADGVISLHEAEHLTARQGPQAKAVGHFLDKDEFEVVRRVASDIQSGNLVAKPGAAETLQEFIDKGPDSRGKHIRKGGGIGKIMRRIGGFFGGTIGGMGGWFLGAGAAGAVSGALGASGFAAGVFGVGAFLAAGGAVILGCAAVGAALGHGVGMIKAIKED